MHFSCAEINSEKKLLALPEDHGPNIALGGTCNHTDSKAKGAGNGRLVWVPSTTQYDPFLRFEIHGLALVA
jgi:hypothetical protein